MRNPFVAVDAATDLRARARVLRRSWETTMGGGTGAGVRPVIERSWRRLTDAGLDPDHLHPRRASTPRGWRTCAQRRRCGTWSTCCAAAWGASPTTPST